MFTRPETGMDVSPPSHDERSDFRWSHCCSASGWRRKEKTDLHLHVVPSGNFCMHQLRTQMPTQNASVSQTKTHKHTNTPINAASLES